MRGRTSFLHLHRCPRTSYFFSTVPSRIHSAHINRDVAVHYRWHALHGRKVRQLYAERRSGREVAIVEAEPGVAIVIAAWMLDPAICAAMSLGSPTVDIIGLTDLDRLLRALGLRRACFAEPLSIEEVLHANTDASGRPRQAALSTLHGIGSPGAERDDSGRSQHRRAASGPPVDGSCKHGPQGDRR